MTHLTCAVILAAGRGQRLKSVLPDKPKGFIELDGLPIIERSIRQLKQAGLSEIIIVTGYAAGYYEALAQRRQLLNEMQKNAAQMKQTTGTGDFDRLMKQHDALEKRYDAIQPTEEN